ncbi:MAG: hypothetical protein RSA89_04900, partial [Raoultibacter sp.]
VMPSHSLQRNTGSILPIPSSGGQLKPDHEVPIGCRADKAPPLALVDSPTLTEAGVVLVCLDVGTVHNLSAHGVEHLAA